MFQAWASDDTQSIGSSIFVIMPKTSILSNFFLHKWSHGDGTFPWGMDGGMGIITQVDLVFARKVSYAFKPVQVL